MNNEPHPQLRKQSLSQYLTSECDRQLALELWRKYEDHKDMPARQVARAGLELITREGREWELQKVRDLGAAFADDALVGNPSRDENGDITRWNPIALQEALSNASPTSFVVEGEFVIGPTFVAAHDLGDLVTQHRLGFAALRPDLLQVTSIGPGDKAVDPTGALGPLETGDDRIALRVIDIKLTAEPSRGHFAEVTYYGCALSAWLEDQGLNDQYVVIANVALWPGSHDASEVLRLARAALEEDRELTDDERLEALEQDLEAVPFDVIALRLRRFFDTDLVRALETPWRDLDWHVDGRCRNCDWLGQKWRRRDGTPTWNDDHCIPTAETEDHLSRVAFISRGASAVLRERDITTVEQLAALQPTDVAFNDHQGLRTERGVLAGRATSLLTDDAAIPAGAGTSAVMPRWVDLRIRISVDFDVGSAISIAFAAEANWSQPFESRTGGDRASHNYPFRHFTVQDRSLDAERERLSAFLGYLAEIITDANERDHQTTYQVYIWDRVQYDHLVRVIGRHLPSLLRDNELRNLVWLFPPEEVAENAQQHTRNSPICIVRDVVRLVVGAPLPHYYSLLNLARTYWPGWVDDEPNISVHPLFEDPLSDQIPSERAHEIWSRSTGRRDWQETTDQLTQALRVRLRAMRFVADRIVEDLGTSLTSRAPKVRLSALPPDLKSRVSFDGQLWYAYARLNAAIDELEIHQDRARPIHDREARFVAARLPQRLHGEEADEALAILGLAPSPRRWVYRLGEGSREVKAKVGDFNWSLAPEADPHFLDRSIWAECRNHGLENDVPQFLRRKSLDEITAITIAGIDRDAGLIACDLNDFEMTAQVFESLHAVQAVPLERHVVLSRRPGDFFTKRLLESLQAIGNPRVAADRADPGVVSAMGMEGRRGARRSDPSPAADAIWTPEVLAGAPGAFDPEASELAMAATGLTLNASQLEALRSATSSRLSLIWGPPGTGKSRTLRGIVAGVVQSREGVRVLICGPTYTAVDNVFDGLRSDLEGNAEDVVFARLRSATRTDADIPADLDYPVSTFQPEERVVSLRSRLSEKAGTTVVATVPQQVHNLLKLNDNEPLGQLFDLIVIDEASQLDVAQSVLALASLAEGGTVVVAGDHLQLPPIHASPPPLGLESMVGSLYSYLSDRHQVTPTMLEINYRSNRTIVDFIRTAGYGDELSAHSPGLAASLYRPIDQKPADWPDEAVVWSESLCILADPEVAISCFVYPEGRSSQWNHFEAATTAALLRLYWGSIQTRLDDGLRDEDGDADNEVAGAEHFFAKSVGVVTPHRAQQSLVISYLRRSFDDIEHVTDEMIRGCVDTVERFQGQERDVIIATFALGDPDSISNEEEFLLNLNRFNVMASRPRAKLVVLVSDEVVIHLARDTDVLRGSALLKSLVSSYCDSRKEHAISYLKADGAELTVEGSLRTRTDM